MVWRFYMKMWFLFFQMYEAKREKGKILFDKNNNVLSLWNISLKMKRLKSNKSLLWMWRVWKGPNGDQWLLSEVGQLLKVTWQWESQYCVLLLATGQPWTDTLSPAAESAVHSFFWPISFLFLIFPGRIYFCNRNYSNRGIK